MTISELEESINVNLIKIKNQSKPHAVKTGRHDFYFILLKGEVRENLGDFQKACIDFNFAGYRISLYLSQNKCATQ
jgi:hypothetical protein